MKTIIIIKLTMLIILSSVSIASEKEVQVLLYAQVRNKIIQGCSGGMHYNQYSALELLLNREKIANSHKKFHSACI